MKVRWGWVLLAALLGYNVGQCSSNTAHADASTRSERALEDIARTLKRECSR